MTLEPLHAHGRYCLVPEGGLRLAHTDDPVSLRGSQWVALQTALGENPPFTVTLHVCAEVGAELKPQLRTLLHYHCGVQTLRTRQMMMDIYSL